MTDSQTESDVLGLSDFFTVAARPEALRVLPFSGIIRDKAQIRFGFVYQPPRHIENLCGQRQMNPADIEARMPESLFKMLARDNSSYGSRDEATTLQPLGDRFFLARTLATSLYVLHAAGWVHKK